jgi:hypothetical protein
VAAGLVNATAQAATVAGGVHRTVYILAGVVKGVRIAGNIFSAIALVIPF